MKLHAGDGSELMEVNALKTEGGNLIVEGTLMGAMPIQAVLTPGELRTAFKLLSLKTLGFILGMLFRR
jgi:hypothetical protein